MAECCLSILSIHHRWPDFVLEGTAFYEAETHCTRHESDASPLPKALLRSRFLKYYIKISPLTIDLMNLKRASVGTSLEVFVETCFSVF